MTASTPADAAEAERQATALVGALTVEASRAKRWRYVWAGINGLSTAVPLAALPLVRRELWPDLVVGSVASAVSTGFTLLWPLDVEAVPSQLVFISNEGACQRLRWVQETFDSAAEDERRRRAWPWHVANLGFSAALGAVLAFGFHHPGAGFITGLSGFAVGEAQLFTQPARLNDTQPASSRLGLYPIWPVSPAPTAFVGIVLVGPLP